MRFVIHFCYAKFGAVGEPDNASGPAPRPIFVLWTRPYPAPRQRIAVGPLVRDMRRRDEEINETGTKADDEDMR